MGYEDADVDYTAGHKSTIIKVSIRDAVNELKLSLTSPIRSVMLYHCNVMFDPFISMVDDTIFLAQNSDEEQS